MGEVEGSGCCHPNINTDHLLPRGALPSSRKHVQSQDGLTALRELNRTCGESREVKHPSVSSGKNRQAGEFAEINYNNLSEFDRFFLPSGVFEERQRVLAIALSTDDHDS